MARTEASRWIVAVITVAVIAGCGGTTTTGTERHVDVADAAAGGSRNGGGGAGGSSGGSSGSGLVSCNDGTGNTDCCPPSAVDGGPCDASIPRCSRGGCHGGFTSYLYCGADGIWIAGHGLIPCGVDAGPDGSVSQMSCSQLQTAWSSYARGHSSCTTDADCTTFEAIAPGWSPCDAPPGLNRVLNVEFVGEAQPFADRYFQAACGGDEVTRPNARNGLWSDFGYDGTALTNPRCVSGSCSADSLQCNTPTPFDGGSGDASRTSCPGTAGPTMVRVPAPDGTTYCVDSTEVTNYEYLRFLQAKDPGTNSGVDTSGQDPWCSWNIAYKPQDPSCVAQFDAYARPDHPVVCIDWCDAYAYCKWAGKHLCGKIGGGAGTYSEFSNATMSQWFNACSKGGTLAYPYGNTFDAYACNSWANGSTAVVPVRTMSKCEGGYEGLFDMSGNVWEWEDSCQSYSGGAPGGDDICHIRGGSVADNEQGTACASDYENARHDVGNALGFRCCAE